MITVLTTNNERKEINPSQKLELSWLQSQVDGLIELIVSQKPLTTGLGKISKKREELIINEEGKLFELPYNELATKWYHENVGTHDFIVGDAVLLTPPHRLK